MNTGLYGSFTSTGNNEVIDLGVEIQKFESINWTKWKAQDNGYGYKYTWHPFFGTSMAMEYHPAGDHTSAVDTSANAFQLIDSARYVIGSTVAVTSSTDATRPVFATGDTSGLSDGTIVRITSSDTKNFEGQDFSIDTIIVNTSFRLASTLATTPGATTAGACFYQIVAPNRQVYDTVFPSKRSIISNIAISGTSAVVTTLVESGYSVGQRVRFYVPSSCGMIQLDGLRGRISAVESTTRPFTFTVDIDVSAFTAFKFPIATVTGADLRMATVVPIGDTYQLDAYGKPQPVYAGATRNTAFKGVVLTAGTTSPAGVITDEIVWFAQKLATPVY